MRFWLFGCVLFAFFSVFSLESACSGDIPPAIDAPPPVPPPPPEDPKALPKPPPPGDAKAALPLPLGPAVAPLASAPPPAGTPLAETPVAVPEGPAKPGQIMGGRVNVRSGPSTSYEIIVTVNEKTSIIVYATSGEWVKIGYPETEACYVHQDYIEGSVPADIPEAGRPCMIKADSVSLRARPWEKSTIVGDLNKGDSILVTGLRGPWAKIKAPPSARAWVFAKYVQFEGQVVEAAMPKPPEGDGPGTGGGVAPKKGSVAEEVALLKKEKAEEFSRHEEARRTAEEQKLDKIITETNAELEKIEKETQTQTESVTPEVIRAELEQKQLPGGEKQMGGYTGWIEYIGWLGKRPAAFRLVQGEEIVFLLRSAKHDLRQYINRRVAVDGFVEPAPGFEANVLNVETVRVLGEPPPAVKEQTETPKDVPSSLELPPKTVKEKESTKEPAPKKRKQKTTDTFREEE